MTFRQKSGMHQLYDDVIVQNQPNNPVAHNFFSTIKSSFQVLIQRNRQNGYINQLLDLDDHRLEDIGVTRRELQNALYGDVSESVSKLIESKNASKH